jgi:hypothetical protein
VRSGGDSPGFAQVGNDSFRFSRDKEMRLMAHDDFSLRDLEVAQRHRRHPGWAWADGG